MPTPTARLLLRLLIAALATFIVLLLADSSERALGTGPYLPPDCVAAGEPSPDGPAAPTDLIVTWDPYYLDGILLDAFAHLTWTDNSDDEACFVIERKYGSGDYSVAAAVSPNQATFSEPATGCQTYRIYAASATARSAYSNESAITATCHSATPTPSLSPSPSSADASPTTPTASVAEPKLTPAELPFAGGGPPTASGIQAAVVLVVIGVIAVAVSLFVAGRRIQ